MYDATVKKSGIEYGIIQGSELLLYIKVGNGGSIYGYEEKYLRMARQAHTAYGVSVVVASNPVESAIGDAMRQDSAMIEICFPHVRKIYAFGHSNGGQMLAAYAHTNPKIRRVLCVNAPLLINLHKTTEGISRFGGEQMTMLYGAQDPSARWVELLKRYRSDVCDYAVIPGADHHFKDMIDAFIALPMQYLLLR